MKKYIVILLFFPLVFPAFAQDDNNSEEDNETNVVVIENSYGTVQNFSFDFGINSYHNEGTFPDEENQPYGVRPWGSWYVALNSIQRTHIGGALFLEWGGGFSWYNFKFQNDNVTMVEGPEQVEFITDFAGQDVAYEKSKLTVSHVNVSFVPVIQFGSKKQQKHSKFWKDWYSDYDERGFRIGVGGYAGYRLGSRTKVKVDGDKDKERDNFYLENLRYGLRFQMGYRGTDIFVNYDLNNLFSENRGPELSAISFGLMF